MIPLALAKINLCVEKRGRAVSFADVRLSFLCYRVNFPGAVIPVRSNYVSSANKLM
jgi:hypothetical protein